MIDEYGGAFLSDVVDLGKTYMSALLTQHLNEPCLVITPPHLLNGRNPSSWPSVFRESGALRFWLDGFEGRRERHSLSRFNSATEESFCILVGKIDIAATNASREERSVDVLCMTFKIVCVLS